MTIHLSCGHEAKDGCLGVDVSWEGEDCIAGEGFVPTTFYASYCHKCAMDFAAQNERERIIAWLRENSTPHNDIDEWADEIEAGEHLK